MGKKYKVARGRYQGRMCRPLRRIGGVENQFVEVIFCDSWGKDTKLKDAIPVSHLDI